MSNRSGSSPSVYHTAELLESCRIIEEAAAKRQSGFFGLTLTQEQCRHLSFAVLEQIESLEESYEADEPEVKDGLRSSWQPHVNWQNRNIFYGLPASIKFTIVI